MMGSADYTMMRAELVGAIAPFLAAALAAFVATLAFARLLTGRLRRLRLPRFGEAGTVELEFAMAFPFFLMSVLTVVQMALLINATLIVDYAAFCAARSAAVWVPYSLPNEPPGTLAEDRSRSEKWTRIRRAATFATLPISPRATTLITGALGLDDAPQEDREAVLQLARSRQLDPSAVDFVQLTADLLDKWITSRQLTNVQLLDENGDASERFELNQPVTARVTYRFYMNVPVVGTLIGSVIGGRFGGLIGPYFVPIRTSYSLLAAQS
jgi:hypothetical protein